MIRSLAIAAALACLVVAPGQAQIDSTDEAPGFGLHGIGGNVGITDPESGLDVTYNLAAHANLGSFIPSAPRLIAHPSLSYWSGDFVSEFGINADVRYLFPMKSNLMLYAGGGFGLFWATTEYEFIDFITLQPTTVSDTESNLGLTLLGGISPRLATNLLASVEARIKLGGVDTVSLGGGLTYMFAR
jgi:opacity protein-like surface antigen